LAFSFSARRCFTTLSACTELRTRSRARRCASATALWRRRCVAGEGAAIAPAPFGAFFFPRRLGFATAAFRRSMACISFSAASRARFSSAPLSTFDAFAAFELASLPARSFASSTAAAVLRCFASIESDSESNPFTAPRVCVSSAAMASISDIIGVAAA
jgi:hypothetical protein